MPKLFKVKYGINFKELEKYGYEKDNGKYVKYTSDTYRGAKVAIVIGYYSNALIAKCYCWAYAFSPIMHSVIMRKGKPVSVDKKYIQDLIQAGLVEEIIND